MSPGQIKSHLKNYFRFKCSQYSREPGLCVRTMCLTLASSCCWKPSSSSRSSLFWKSVKLCSIISSSRADTAAFSYTNTAVTLHQHSLTQASFSTCAGFKFTNSAYLFHNRHLLHPFLQVTDRKRWWHQPQTSTVLHATPEVAFTWSFLSSAKVMPSAILALLAWWVSLWSWSFFMDAGQQKWEREREKERERWKPNRGLYATKDNRNIKQHRQWNR